MLPNPEDTIVALSSAPGSGARAIVRLSGKKAIAIAEKLSLPPSPYPRHQRRVHSSELRLAPLHSRLPADLYIWPAPKTYTGQELVEIHTISSPPLLDLLIAECLNAGARAAQPGEFTLRAFLAGKLDLTRAEAVLGVIDAGNANELKQALDQLAGGITQPLHVLREDLLNLLADVEAGLDFSDEDIQFVSQEILLKRLAKGLALVTLLRKQIDARSRGPQGFRVVLAGEPNAGKSCLFNALVGHNAALVSPVAGTTRDYLVARLHVEGIALELVDTAGLRDTEQDIEEQAQSLGREEMAKADLILLCLESARARHNEVARLPENVPVLRIATKVDLAPAPEGMMGTSATLEIGVSQLKTVLAERARSHARPVMAPSLSRCRHHVETCLDHLRHAHALTVEQQPAELIALEIRSALEQLGEMVGAVYSDDLLDRIFSRFCIGK